jgi:hypothetical protein
MQVWKAVQDIPALHIMSKYEPPAKYRNVQCKIILAYIGSSPDVQHMDCELFTDKDGRNIVNNFWKDVYGIL